MSKRRRVSELMFKRSHGFGVNCKIPIVAVLSGTGTVAAAGVVTLVASNTATQCYVTVASASLVGTLCGTQNAAGAPI